MNAATKHTPGPWMAAAGPSSIVGWPVVAAGGRLICTIATPPNNLQRIGKEAAGYEAFLDECAVNARLIAVAPEMLAALKAMVLNDVHTYRVCHKAAVAAIAKAEGK